jgi:hypothetical protein
MARVGPGEIETPHEVWVIDTSSILQVRRESWPARTRRRVFTDLTNFVTQGKLVFPAEVYGELDRGAAKLSPGSPDEPLDWAKVNRTAATRHGNNLDFVKRVLDKVSDVLDVNKTSGADEADPYVLGLALRLKEEGHEVTVVSEERKDRPDKTSINTACGLLRLYCVPLVGLLRDHGLLP